MNIHKIHDLGEEDLIKPYEPLTAACGRVLRVAYAVKHPREDRDVCPACLTIAKRNRYQNYRCAVEMDNIAEESNDLGDDV